MLERGETPRQLTASESQRVQQAMVEHCESLADRIAVLDPPPQIADPLIGRDVLLEWRQATSSSYAVAYTPWLLVADPDPTATTPTVATPPSGHAIGQMARNDAVRGVHHAPANTPVDWAADWSVDYSADDHALLNDEGINVLRAGLDGVLRIGGARTLSAEPAVQFLNVRRLLIYVERSLHRLLAWCVHEPNNHETRAKVQLCATTLLHSLFERGAFVGATPDDAFAVRCDDVNNPPEVRANGELHLDIALAPSTPMEVILLRIGRVEGSLDLSVTELGGGGLWPR
jgi:phage tail sheath protein FI